jgi:arylsulfatase A-like enzyme
MLEPGTKTLQATFAAAGFETASFVTNTNAGSLPGLDREFDHFHDAIKHYWNRDALRTLPEKAVTDWLDINGDRRFFLYIHTAEPHRPYTPPSPYDTLFNPGYKGQITGYYEGENGYGSSKTEEDLRQVRALYDGEIRFADASLGQFLTILAERGLHENTIVAVTADHGEEFLEHGGFNHGQSLYNELLHVPLVLSVPDLSARARVSEPVQLIDLAPTLLELTGVPVPMEFEGESLVGLATGVDGGRFARREIYASNSLEPVKMTVMREEWKGIYTAGSELELYKLDEDPGELRNRALDEPELAAELVALMWSWRQSRRDRGRPAESREMSQEDVERLRSLGYIE